MISLEEIKQVKNKGKRKRLLKIYRQEQKKELIKKYNEEKAKNEKEVKELVKKKRTKVVTIDGIKYIKNLETGKLYSMPRTITTRKIARNRMRNLMKAQGVTKINKNLASFWASEECRKVAYGNVK